MEPIRQRPQSTGYVQYMMLLYPELSSKGEPRRAPANSPGLFRCCSIVFIQACDWQTLNWTGSSVGMCDFTHIGLEPTILLYCTVRTCRTQGTSQGHTASEAIDGRDQSVADRDFTTLSISKSLRSHSQTRWFGYQVATQAVAPDQAIMTRLRSRGRHARSRIFDQLHVRSGSAPHFRLVRLR